MPFDFGDRASVAELIRVQHWEQRRSIRSLERELGASNGRLSAACIRHGIEVRSKEDGARIANSDPAAVAKRTGPRHWAWGKTAETSAVYRRHRERMIAANPTKNRAIRSDAAASKAAVYRQRLTPSEQYLLLLFGHVAVAQFAIGPYVVDFAFVSDKVAVEVDGKNHWSARRSAHDLARDAWLVGQGWRVVRIENDRVFRPRHLVAVLQDLIPGLNITSLPPDEPIRGRVYQYRVLLRDAENPAGRKV